VNVDSAVNIWGLLAGFDFSENRKLCRYFGEFYGAPLENRGGICPTINVFEFKQTFITKNVRCKFITVAILKIYGGLVDAEFDNCIDR